MVINSPNDSSTNNNNKFNEYDVDNNFIYEASNKPQQSSQIEETLMVINSPNDSSINNNNNSNFDIQCNDKYNNIYMAVRIIITKYN